MFTATANPLWLAIALHWCSAASLRLPTWLRLEWQRVCLRLIETRTPEERRWFVDAPSYRHWKDAVVTAFGFRLPAGGGSSDPFRARLRDVDNLHLAIRMRVLIDGVEHLGTVAAAEVVAASCNLSSEKMARDAWTTFKGAARVGALDEQRRYIASLDDQIQVHQRQAPDWTIALGRPVTASSRKTRSSKTRRK